MSKPPHHSWPTKTKGKVKPIKYSFYFKFQNSEGLWARKWNSPVGNRGRGTVAWKQKATLRKHNPTPKNENSHLWNFNLLEKMKSHCSLNPRKPPSISAPSIVRDFLSPKSETRSPSICCPKRWSELHRFVLLCLTFSLYYFRLWFFFLFFHVILLSSIISNKISYLHLQKT